MQLSETGNAPNSQSIKLEEIALFFIADVVIMGADAETNLGTGFEKIRLKMNAAKTKNMVIQG